MRKLWMSVLGLMLGALAGGVLLASPAHATYGFNVDADGSACGEVTLFGTPGALSGTYKLWWSVEGDASKGGVFDLPGSQVIEFDEDYNGGMAQIIYFGTSPESDENIDPAEVTVDTDCVEPTTAPPTTAPPTSAPPTTEPPTSAPPTTEPPSTTPPDDTGGGDDTASPTLPRTGSSLPVVLGGAAVLLGLGGGGLMLLARRKRPTFTAGDE